MQVLAIIGIVFLILIYFSFGMSASLLVDRVYRGTVKLVTNILVFVSIVSWPILLPIFVFRLAGKVDKDYVESKTLQSEDTTLAKKR